MFTLTLGADPELICFSKNRFVPACSYFKRNASFGTDGKESIAEIRPGIAITPLDLCAKIRTILKYGSQKYNDIELFAGHFCLWIPDWWSYPL